MLRFFLFFCLSISSFSQVIRVVDSRTNKSVEGATVQCVNTGDKNVTNENGETFLKNKIKKLCIYHINYDTLRIDSLELDEKISLVPKYQDLNKIVLSVSRFAEKKQKIPEHIELLDKKEIDQISAQTSADLLTSIPGIRVQKSQLGGGSPVIRGMESNRVLLVVDGVRMNNAIYRKGHLQNSITVSPLAIERVEVVFGPTSVVYGSDALGGVIHYYTKQLDYSAKPNTDNNLFYRHSTVNHEHSMSFSSYTSRKKWSSYSNVSFSSFGDLRIGENRTHGYQNWGKVFQFSENSEKKYYENSTVNRDLNVQKNTGYHQLDMLQKFMLPVHEQIDLVLNGQYSTSSDIPNFGKLNDLTDGDLKFAEWRYGPQKRFMLSAQAKFKDYNSLLENGDITLAYQNISESRINRQFGSLDRVSRFENVDVYSLNSDFYKSLTKKGDRKLFYGLEVVHNKVGSSARGETLLVDESENRVLGVENVFDVDTRYPDGGSTYTSAAVYSSYRQHLDKKNVLNIGLRFTNTHLTANWNNTVEVDIPDNRIELNNTALTGSIGYVYNPSTDDKISVVVSKGFRSPNVDDIGKIRSKSSKLTVPNMRLTPEHLYSAEVGYARRFRKKNGHVSVNAYYTLLDDYIARYPSSEFGNSIDYDGDTFENENILANTNLGQAYIYGATLNAFAELVKNVKSNLSLTYTKGKSYDSQEPLSSIPPMYGSFSLGLYKPKFNVVFDYKFSLEKSLDEYNLTEGIDNLDETPNESGTPEWQIFNLSSSYFLSSSLRVQIQLQNILDVHYKEFGSSISAPGRNLSASVAYSF